MTNLNKRQRDTIYPHVVAKQGGEYCVGCGRDKESLMRDGHKPEFCLDCIDNSGDHKRIENLQLLCHSCNTRKNHPQIDIPYHRTPTPEMVAGKKYESDFRRWVQGQYLENANTGLEFEYLVSSGAEKIGCSPETIKRYLKKMASNEGMYEWEDRFGSILLVLKKEYR
jgi:hypothetical protein